MSTQTKNRQWFSRKLRRFLWSREMSPLLERLGCGWCDGGCHTCAKALYLYLIASGTIDPVAVSFRLIANQEHWAHHVVVSVSHAGRIWYLDANGVSSARQLLRYWEQEELVRGPWISDYWNAYEVEDVLPSLDDIALILLEKLFAAFGPFSPAWLETNGIVSSVPMRAEGLDACMLYELNALGQKTGRKAGPFSKEQANLLAFALTIMPTSVRYSYIARPCEQ